MKLERYPLKSVRSFTVFEFASEGPKGTIRKIIQFQQTTEPFLYNLAFGDKNINIKTGKLDDLVISNNGDSEKVLATVIAALYIFFDAHPRVFVYASGSSISKTRLYRMGITKYYKEMTNDFYL